MKPAQLKEIAELVVGLSVIASLVFVGIQLRQDRKVASIESVVAATNDRKYMAELISDNGEVWVKGIAGEPLTNLEKVIFESLASAHNLDHYSAWYRATQLNHINPDKFSTSYASILIRNPGLLANWRETRELEATDRERTGRRTGADTWGKAVERAIAQLDGTRLPAEIGHQE